ncbi:hypothetical protein DOY81_013068 [Sarcophaga bullata]|nr:hypothetical protein DOY81_013068 [Sarcophaga bullata]
MSITLDVNAFLNKDACATGCDEIIMEKEMETNIFEEIEHLLKFNKNLEYGTQQKEEESRKKKQNVTRSKGTINLDFFNSTADDFLLTTDSQSLLGEDPLLFTVEQDRLQPISSRFMVPGIYKRIEGVAFNDGKLEFGKPNVFISEMERHGRIVSKKDFERLYILAEECEAPPLSRVLLVAPMESDVDEEEEGEVKKLEENKNLSEANTKKDQIPKEWDALNRLAYDILKLTNRDHIVIDRKRNEIIRTQYNTQQKTIYKFLAPELMGLEPGPASTNQIIDVDQEDQTAAKQKPVNKLGRPRKRPQDEQIVKKSNKLHKKESSNTKTTTNDAETLTKNATNVRTRSGRLIKTPSSLQVSNNKQLLPPALNPQENIKDLLNELKDGDYHNSKHKHITNEALNETETLVEATTTETPSESTHSPSKRKVPPEAICPTCKKIFLAEDCDGIFTQHPRTYADTPHQYDTLTDEAAQKLNLSAGGKLLPPSEESLLRAVDDLVQTDINKIHASSMLQQQISLTNNSQQM